jgi:CBS domain-containing protein
MTISYKGFMRERIERHPVTISPDASLLEARQLIHEKGNRHLVVVDENRTWLESLLREILWRQPLLRARENKRFSLHDPKRTTHLDYAGHND